MSTTYARCQYRDQTKVCYPSPAKARKYARQGKEKAGVTLYPYRCGRCGKWHLSRQQRYVRP